jgi:hypothetical protein
MGEVIDFGKDFFKFVLKIVVLAAVGLGIIFLLGWACCSDEEDSPEVNTSYNYTETESTPAGEWEHETFDAVAFLGLTRAEMQAALADYGVPASTLSNYELRTIATVNKQPFDSFSFDYSRDGDTCHCVTVTFFEPYTDDAHFSDRLDWCGLDSLLSTDPEIDEFGFRRWRTGLPESVNLVVDGLSYIEVFMKL